MHMSSGKTNFIFFAACGRKLYEVFDALEEA